jgi:hypothetical protein
MSGRSLKGQLTSGYTGPTKRGVLLQPTDADQLSEMLAEGGRESGGRSNRGKSVSRHAAGLLHENASDSPSSNRKGGGVGRPWFTS